MTAPLHFTPLDASALMEIRAAGRFAAWRDLMTRRIAENLVRFPGRIGWRNGRPVVAGGIRPDADPGRGAVWMVADAQTLSSRDYLAITAKFRLLKSLAPLSGFSSLVAIGQADWPETNLWLRRLGFQQSAEIMLMVPSEKVARAFNLYECECAGGGDV